MTEIIPRSWELKEDSAGPTAKWWYRRPGVVYFFAAGNPPVAIKIGVTTIAKEDELQEDDWRACIHQRHKQIQSSNHETIELLGFIRFRDGDLPARRAELHERALHKQFKELQLFKAHTMGAEWFKPGAKLWDYIQNKTSSPYVIETPESLKILAVIGLPINR